MGRTWSFGAVVIWLFQGQWASPDPGLVAVILVAAGCEAGVIVVRRAMCHARV